MPMPYPEGHIGVRLERREAGSGFRAEGPVQRKVQRFETAVVISVPGDEAADGHT